MAYATKEDLAAWLGYADQAGDPDVSLLPDDADRLLFHASRVIDEATFGRIDSGSEEQIDVAMNATTAQCEYWIDGLGESVDIHPKMDGYKAGKTDIAFKGGIPKLAPRARRELFSGGLLSRKVRSI